MKLSLSLSLPRLRCKTVLSLAAIPLTLLLTSSALGFPWNIDMMWQVALRPFKHEMPLPPSGTLPIIGGGLSEDDGGTVAVNPGSTPASIEQGRKLYRIYCAVCHAEDARGGGPVGKKMLMEAPSLRFHRPDKYIFDHIREGGPMMPAYAEMLSIEEAWAVMHYVRTLEEE